MPETSSRRQFIAAAGAALGLGPALAACGGGGPSQASQCAGYSSLSPSDIQQRQTLGYVDKTPEPAQVCDNCRLYNTPEGGEACGGCQLFAGPVLPKGWCRSWAAMA